jgi:two-component system, NarL family, sensor histidine kinase FusK
MKRYLWTLLHILLLTLAYFVFAKLGLALDAISGFATLFWVPSGLAVSVLFLVSPVLAPGVFLGAFLANLSTGAPLPVALGIGMGNMLEALLGAYLLKQLAVTPSFSRFKDVLNLGIVASLGATVSALIGVESLLLGHVIAPSAFAATGQAWWIGDALSILLITPFALSISTWIQQKMARRS